MEKENFRFCRKCLTRDMIDKDKYFETLQELIDSLPDEVRAPSDLYEERLKTCIKCERLADGMCAACGCYVELRTATKTQECPYERW